jgi:hypothetical protein
MWRFAVKSWSEDVCHALWAFPVFMSWIASTRGEVDFARSCAIRELEGIVEIARWLVAFVCLLGVGGFIADFVVWETARQHMKNPAWPQHAKFHNAQTMLMGIGLGLIWGVILFTFRPLTRCRDFYLRAALLLCIG